MSREQHAASWVEACSCLLQQDVGCLMSASDAAERLVAVAGSLRLRPQAALTSKALKPHTSPDL